MFILNNHRHTQRQWGLHKKFKYKVFTLPTRWGLYKKISLVKNLYYNLTKINIVSKSLITVDYFTCFCLKVNKKKFYITFKEILNKFIIHLNLKTFNTILI